MSQKAGPIIIVALLVIIILILWSIRDHQNTFLQKIMFSSKTKTSDKSLIDEKKDEKELDKSKESAEQTQSQELIDTPKSNQSNNSSTSNQSKNQSLTTIRRDTERITGEPIPSNWPGFAPPIGGSNVTSVFVREGQNYMMSADVTKSADIVVSWYSQKLQQSGFTINSIDSEGLSAKNDKYNIRLGFDYGSQGEHSCSYSLNISPVSPINIPPEYLNR